MYTNSRTTKTALARKLLGELSGVYDLFKQTGITSLLESNIVDSFNVWASRYNLSVRKLDTNDKLELGIESHGNIVGRMVYEIDSLTNEVTHIIPIR